jgi:hypothetical protein
MYSTIITLNVTLPLASLSNPYRDSMDCSGDKTYGDLMFNNFLECNAASGFSQQSLQGFKGLFGG